MHNVAAKHAEIRWRYARDKRLRHGPFDRGKLRVAEVFKLASYRRKEDRLDFDPAVVAAEIKDNPRVWTARAIGHRLKLGWQERCDLGLRTMDPHGIDTGELKRRKLQRRATLSRERSRRYRRRKKAAEQHALRHATVQLLKISRNPSAMRVFYTSKPIAQ
jgi:hypothetical protein